MNKKILIGAGIIGGLGILGYGLYYYFKQQTEMIKDFGYKITGISIEKLNLALIKGKLSVLFTNTSDIEASITEFYLDFYFNGTRVGYLQDVTEFTLPAMGNTTIPFQFALNPQFVLNSLANIVQYSTKQKDAKISVKGFATIKSSFVKITVPVSEDFSLKEILSS